jgi:molybdate transport system substrate-binding protein
MKWLMITVLVGALMAPVRLAAGQATPALVRVAAASDLRFALDEIVAAYRAKQPPARVEVTYGSSGTFHAQILQGAPFDLFLSADVTYPNDLISKGKADRATLFTYAIGRIVLWTPSSSPLDLGQGMRVLLDRRIRHVAIANPLHAPYGKAAESAMRAAGVRDAVAAKLVLGENISQAAQFVDSGAADIGLIARSIALAPAMRARGKYWEVPSTLHPLMEQAGVILSSAANRQAAAAFTTFLRSADSRALLTRYGFELPPG